MQDKAKQNEAIESIFEGFLAHLSGERFLSRNTVIAYAADLADFIAFLAEIESSNDLAKATRDELRQYLGRQKMQGRATSTINRRLSCLRRFYRFLRREGIRKDDPASVLMAPKVHRHLPSYLTDDEMQELLVIAGKEKEFREEGRSEFTKTLNLCIFELFYDQGLRCSELIALHDNDFDWWENMLVVRSGKGGKERRLPLSTKAAEMVQQYQKQRDRLKLRHKDGILLLGFQGRPLNRIKVWRLVNEMTRAAGLGHISPHGLRHSFATALMKGGANLRVVQELLGHADISTTTIYTHVDVERLKSIHKKYHPRG